MKQLRYIVLVVLLLPLIACGRGNKTTNESRLAIKEIEYTTKEMVEDRSIDVSNPPQVLGIITARNHNVKVKYSQLGTSIKHIKLDPVFGETFPLGIKIKLMPNNIVAKAEKGIFLFDRSGKFIEMICLDDNPFSTPENGYRVTNSEILGKYVGSVGVPVVKGNKLYYEYVNVPENKGVLMEFIPNNQIQSDTISDKAPKGIPVCNTTPAYRFGSTNGVYVGGDDYFIGYEDKYHSIESKYFMTAVRKISGDTICRFRDYDADVKLVGTTCRNPKESVFYENGGKLHFCQSYNDTIYYFSTPSRIVPKYILNFNGKAINSAQEAMSITVELEERFSVNTIKETADFLFISYLQYGKVSAMGSGNSLKYNLFVWDKKAKQGSHAYIDEPRYKEEPKKIYQPLLRKGLVNDLDDSPPHWTFEKLAPKTYYYINYSKDFIKRKGYRENDVVVSIIE